MTSSQRAAGGEYCETDKTLLWCDSICSLTELRSQIFRVLSSDAETRRLESEDQATSDIPCIYVTDHYGDAGDINN